MKITINFDKEEIYAILAKKLLDEKKYIVNTGRMKPTFEGEFDSKEFSGIEVEMDV